MRNLNDLELLFVITAFLFQIILVIHFSLRKWKFDLAIRYGRIVYALSIPAVIVSVILVIGGVSWSFWLGGFLYLIWAIYGYIIDYIREIQWREPIRWSVGAPYVFLYLAMIMFYWWPLGLLGRPLWFAYAILFVISTALNVTSHKRPT